jgi:hypothetical protein
MPQCVAYDVVGGKVGRCDNIVADEGMMVCSNLKCQRMNSNMFEGARCVIAALFNIMDDDGEIFNGPGGEADELGAVMEASPMLREIDPVVKIEVEVVIKRDNEICEPVLSPLGIKDQKA